MLCLNGRWEQPFLEGRELPSSKKRMGSCIDNTAEVLALFSLVFIAWKLRPLTDCPSIAIILHPGLRYGDIAAGV